MPVVRLDTKLVGIAGPAKWAAVAVLSGLAGAGLTYALTTRGGEPVRVVRPEPAAATIEHLPAPESARADTDLTRFMPRARALGPLPSEAMPLAAAPAKVSAADAPPDAPGKAVSPDSSPSGAGPGASAPIPSKKINLNSATGAELELLPGVGPALAGRIIEHRRANGPFRSVTDLDKVRGIGPRMLEKLAPLVRVN